MNKPIALLTADLHISKHTPICRTDSYLNTLKSKLKFLNSLQKQYNVPVLDAGDVFDKAKPSEEIVSFALNNLPQNFITIAGNHDLPNHNMDIYKKSGLYTLESADKGQTVLNPYETIHFDNMSITAFPYGYYDTDLLDIKYINEKPIRIALIHIMTYQGKAPFVGCNDEEARGIAKKLDMFDIIVSGHNHQSFISLGKPTLVNTGSLMRSNIVQKEYKPHIHLLYDDLSIKRIPVPINDVIDDSHKENKEKRDERMASFIESLSKDVEIAFSFEKNLTALLNSNTIPPEVKNIIEELIN